MPLNLMTLTTAKGPIHINPANIATVEPLEKGGASITLNTGDAIEVKDDHLLVVKAANFRTPDGF